MRERFTPFGAEEHRMELVATIDGVRWINDSKATNINATWFALKSQPDDHVIWIAGGQDKGNTWNDLQELVGVKVRALIDIGKHHGVLERFQDVVELRVRLDTIEKAVKHANSLSQKGDVVLLSPACASFDRYANYEERGRLFRDAVKAL